MANFRAFLFKYWIIIAVVLWVIAWMNRDWLAGGVHPHGFDPQAALIQEATVEADGYAMDAQTSSANGGVYSPSANQMADPGPADAAQETAPVSELTQVTPPALPEAVATTAEPAVQATPDSAADNGADPTAVDAAPAPPEQEGSVGDTQDAAVADTVSGVDAAESLPVSAETAENEGAISVPETETPMVDDASEPVAADSVQQPVVADEGHDVVVEDTSAEDATPAAVQAAPTSEEAADSTEAAATESVAAESVAAESEGAAAANEGENAAAILARARSAYSEGGPRAAAAVISDGLRDLPADAAGRADLFGQLGNFRIEARDVRGALAAFDQALQLLPDQERATMIQQLGPFYDQHHPGRRAYLEQFR